MRKRLVFVFIALIGLSLSMGAMANPTKCYKEPQNAEQARGIGGFDKKSAVEKGYEDAHNPAQDLMGCAMQALYEPIEAVVGHCGCMDAIREMCSFDWTSGVLEVVVGDGAKKAWCLPFAPLFMM